MEFRIGAIFPQLDLGMDPAAALAFAREVEALGFSHIVAYDHVVGADTTNRPDWAGPYDVDSPFLEPLILFSHWAGSTQKIGFMTGIVIAPQRQTVLFAKQAATLDLICNGRLRLGLGIGWNKVEYDALGRPFNRRGALLDEQIPLLRQLWTKKSLTDKGSFHDIVEAGINPLPVQQPIPIWLGGVSDAAIRRAAQAGDGWLPLMSVDRAPVALDQFRTEVERAGRDPADVGIENILFFQLNPNKPPKTPDMLIAEALQWQALGANGIAIDTMRLGLREVDQHLELFARIGRELGIGA